MKTSLYDEIVWLLEHAQHYAGNCTFLVEYADQDGIEAWTDDYEARLAEALRLLKNEPKKEA